MALLRLHSLSRIFSLSLDIGIFKEGLSMCAVLAGAAAFALTMGGICALVITVFVITETRRR